MNTPLYLVTDWHEPTRAEIEEIIERTKGRGGSEDEISMSWSGVEREDGYIEVYSGWGSWTSKILKRAGWACISIRETSFGDFFMRFKASAFRGYHMAFKPDPDRERVPMPGGIFRPGTPEEQAQVVGETDDEDEEEDLSVMRPRVVTVRLS